MYKKTEEMYGENDVDSEDDKDNNKGTEMQNQKNLFAKARAMSDNGGNCFSDDDKSSDHDHEDKADGNNF